MELLNLKETNIMKIKDKHNYQMGGEIAYFAILLSCFVPEMSQASAIDGDFVTIEGKLPGGKRIPMTLERKTAERVVWEDTFKDPLRGLHNKKWDLSGHSLTLEEMRLFPILPELEDLDLHVCGIKSMHWIPNQPNLKKLNLSSNEGIQLNTIPTFSNLEELYMCNCDLRSLDGLPVFPKLKKINIAGNAYIGSVEALSQLPSLEELIAQGCHSIPETLPSLPGLKRLSFEAFERKPLDFLNKVPNLESLNISRYMSREHLILTMPLLSNLRELNFSHCEGFASLRGISEKCPNLESLDFSKNYIFSCSQETTQQLKQQFIESLRELVNLKQLKSLNLSGCSIADENKEIIEALSQLKQLKELNLTAGHRLPKLSEDTLEVLSNTLRDCEIRFTDNRFYIRTYLNGEKK